MGKVLAMKRPTPASGRKQWSKLITEAWQKSIEGILKTGDLLIQAKEDLKKRSEEWLTMVRNDLPFNERTAQRLMSIARNPVISNTAYTPYLPSSWMTLYTLTKIDKKMGDGTLKSMIDDGTVHPKLEQKQAIALIPRKPKKLPDISTFVVKLDGDLTKYYEQQEVKLKAVLKARADVPADPLADLIKTLETVVSKLSKTIAVLKTTKSTPKAIAAKPEEK